MFASGRTGFIVAPVRQVNAIIEERNI